MNGCVQCRPGAKPREGGIPSTDESKSASASGWRRAAAERAQCRSHQGSLDMRRVGPSPPNFSSSYRFHRQIHCSMRRGGKNTKTCWLIILCRANPFSPEKRDLPRWLQIASSYRCFTSWPPVSECFSGVTGGWMDRSHLIEPMIGLILDIKGSFWHHGNN